MGKLSVLVVALCAFAAGLFAALLVASFQSETFTELEKDRDRIATENQELKRRIATEEVVQAKTAAASEDLEQVTDTESLNQSVGELSGIMTVASAADASRRLELRGYRYVDETRVAGQKFLSYGRLISQHRDGNSSYYHFDGQGSTRDLTDATGDVTDTATYSAFGEGVASSGSTVNPFGYKGAIGYYANPETADIYVRRRTYSPAIARWLSVDPLGFDPYEFQEFQGHHT